MRSQEGMNPVLFRFRSTEFDVPVKCLTAYVQWAVDKWSEAQEREPDQKVIHLREMLQR